MGNIRVRFAPSPTGNLHLGSARTALYNWLFAKHHGGDFIVRIEDTDFLRSAPEFEQSILEDLSWLGLNYDEGPGKGGFGPYRQSRRLSLYKSKAKQLVADGKAYYCYCGEQSKVDSVNKKTCNCLGLDGRDQLDASAKGVNPAIRFRVPKEKIVIDDIVYGPTEFDTANIKDFIILRGNGMPTFHLSVVVDDAEMKISHVIRGNDHLPNTPKHILLFKALGYDIPKFAHHSLIMGSDGGKLSKRHGATAVFQYREAGYLHEAVINYLALLSWTPAGEQEIFKPEELMQYFSLEKLSKSPAIFDIGKLNWINGQHIRSYPLEELTQMAIPFLAKDEVKKVSREWLIKMVEATRDDYITLADAKVQSELFFKPLKITKEAKQWLEKDTSKAVLAKLVEVLGASRVDNNDEARAVLKSLSKEMKEQGIKGKDVFMPVRCALTGKTEGPELFYIFVLFGKQKSIKRIESAAKVG
ncbi:MAG: glutamate--tRNA ligase [Actinobacteria bacterium]|nr:MAG: glutamate--tRNA ligase [Actinomycetota bacterium]